MSFVLLKEKCWYKIVKVKEKVDITGVKKDYRHNDSLQRADVSIDITSEDIRA
jgi:hypothetical protein